MRRPTVLLHSALAPSTVMDALRRSIDPEQRTLFSLSGYKGERPVLGEVGKTTFRLQKRRYGRNDFAGEFYGTIEAQTGGSRIQGYFDASRWARYFMRFWLAFAVLCGTPIFVLTLLDVLTGSHHTTGDTWVGLAVPPALVLFGTVLPKMGWAFGRSDRKFMLEFVQQTAAARVEGLETSNR
ncbi:MAG: hypothetical protein ACRD2U_16165 [Terriglobales bacterium]